MTFRLSSSTLLLLGLTCVLDRVSAEGPDFEREIKPILVQNCIACHNAKKKEGGLDLESYAGLMQGGDSGPSVEPGNAADSYMMWRVTGEEEPWMPPKDNAVGAKTLTASEAGLLSAWILAGANDSESSASLSKLHWQSMPESLKPVYALDYSSDGTQFTFGRGNRVFVSNSFATPLTPRELLPPDAETAHLDLVHSIAFSDDGLRIATGGYRNVKVWKRGFDAPNTAQGPKPSKRTWSHSPDRSQLAYGSQSGQLIVAKVGSQPNSADVQVLDSEAFRNLSSVCWLNERKVLTCNASGRWTVADIRSSATSQVTVSHKIAARQLSVIGNNQLIGFDAGGRVFLLKLQKETSESYVASARFIFGLTNILALCSNSHSGLVLMSSAGGDVLLFDAINLKTVTRLQANQYVDQLAINPSNQFAVVGGDQAIQLWDLDAGKVLGEVKQPHSIKQNLSFLKHESERQQQFIDRIKSRLASAEKALTAEQAALKKVVESQQKANKTLAELDQQLNKLTVDLKTLAESAEAATNSADNTAAQKLRKQLTQKEEERAKLQEKRTQAADELAERDQALAAATDSHQRAAALIPTTQTQLEKETAELRAMEREIDRLGSLQLRKPSFVSFAPDGKTFLVGNQNGRTIDFFDAISCTPIATYRGKEPCLATFTNDSDTLFGLGTDGALQGWNLSAPWILERSIGDYQDSFFSDRVTALDFSPDGRLLAVGSGRPSRSGEIHLLDLESFDQVLNVESAHSDSVLALQFDPLGRTIASAAADKVCKTWDVPTGTSQQVFEGHTHHVLGLSWRSDGAMLATASADQSIKLWNTDTGSQIRTLGGFAKEVTSLAFANSQLAAASADGTVRLYDSNSGKLMRSMRGDKALFRLSIAGPQKLLSAGGQLGQIWTWNLDDGKLVATYPENEPER